MAHTLSASQPSPVHRWPFPAKSDEHRRSGQPARPSARTRVAHAGRLTRIGMARDICLVLVWAAMIPGLLWLGSLVGW